MCITIEGLYAKRTYIEFWPIFIFCTIKLIFGRLTCFDMKSIVPYLSRSICASFSRNEVCKKTQLSSGDLLFNEKKKKPFVLSSFISHIIIAALLAQAIKALNGADVNLFCRDTGSKQGRLMFFLFFYLFLYLCQKPKHLFKENKQSKLLKVIIKVRVASKSAFERFAH